MVVVVTVAGSCGGGTGSSSKPSATRTLSAQDKVEQSIADFYSGAPKAVCGSLSSSALKRLGGRSRCPSAVPERKPERYNLDSVRISSGSAIAVVRSGGKVIQFTLVDQDGDWKVSQPLPTEAR